jgi:acetylornithine deacetylase
MAYFLSIISLFVAALATTCSASPYRDSLLELHKGLVSIPSISGSEGRVGDYLVEYLESKGFATQRQPIAPVDNGTDRFNVIAWHGKATEFPTKVLVTSHIDVVPPHIDYEITDCRITENTMIKGRGSVDAKGSVAAMIVAVEELIKAGPGMEDITLLFVVGEEVSGDGMREFSNSLAKQPSERQNFEAAIFGEPTENKLVCGHKGILGCTIVATGVAAHRGYPWLGKSANELMVRAWERILAADLGGSELYGNTTINLGVWEGGIAGNVVPASATVKLLARIASGTRETGAEAVQSQLQSILDDVDPVAFNMTCPGGAGPIQCNCNVQGKLVV